MEPCWEGNRKRWERRRAMIAAGLPVPRHGRLPGHRRGEPYIIARARHEVSKELEELEHHSDADAFAALRKLALRTIKETLLLPNKLGDFDGDQELFHKRRRLQLEAAQGVMANAIKIDEGQLRDRQESDRLALMREKLRNLPAPEKDG
jgi:hypothetical protein